MDNTIKIGLLKKRSGDYVAIASPYTDTFVKKVRELEGRIWDNVNRRWVVSINLLDKVKTLFPDAEYTDGIKGLDNKIIVMQAVNRENFLDLIKNYDLSKPIANGITLFKHQAESVLKMLKFKRQILALDMGLGKTFTSLVAAKILQDKEGYETIVICPVSLIEGWRRDSRTIGLKQVQIFSWSKIPKSPLRNFTLIADEAHYAQAGSRTLRGKAFLELAKSAFCKACYPLTGTPMKNGRPINLLPLLEAVKSPLAKDKRYYQIHFCDAHATNFTKWDVNGCNNLAELHQKTQDVIIRKTKKECLDLPDKMRVFRAAELSSKALDAYNKKLRELKESYLARIKSGAIIGGSEALVMVNYLRLAGSIAKVETALELITEVLDENKPAVVFSFYTEPLQSLAKELKALNINTELLIGSVKPEDRQPMVDRFQKGISKVFLLSMAGGVGINLFTADTIILIDRPWTPGDTFQIEDRLHRIGQRNSVTSIWLQFGEVDKHVDEILADKQNNINTVLEGGRLNQHELATNILKDFFK